MVVKLLKNLPNTADAEGALGKVCLNTMASGELPAELKFFLYAQESNSASFLLVQAVVSKLSPSFSYIIKTNVKDASKKCDLLVEKMKSALDDFM